MTVYAVVAPWATIWEMLKAEDGHLMDFDFYKSAPYWAPKGHEADFVLYWAQIRSPRCLVDLWRSFGVGVQFA